MGRLRLAQSKHHPGKTSTWADAGATLPDGQLWGKTAVKHDQEARRWRATATMEHAPNPFSILSQLDCAAEEPPARPVSPDLFRGEPAVVRITVGSLHVAERGRPGASLRVCRRTKLEPPSEDILRPRPPCGDQKGALFLMQREETAASETSSFLKWIHHSR